MTRVVVTGASGFVGQNLVQALRTRTEYEVIAVTRDTPLESLRETTADHVIHLAGANRPTTEKGFRQDNVDFAERILSCIRPSVYGATFHYASTIQVLRNDAYGRSKKAGEELVARLAPEAGWSPVIWRLPNLFGKWCRPHYNSFVATFMDQAVRGQPFSINDAEAQVELLYIDDLVDMFLDTLARAAPTKLTIVESYPTTRTTVGEVAAIISVFRDGHDTTHIPFVGVPLTKQLHATFLSYLDQDARIFNVKRFASNSGSFSELYKAESFGQVSVLTIEPGESRGNHYHHTKVENFHIAVGRVDLIESDARGGAEMLHTLTAGDSFWTRPGWVHTLKNSGDTLAVLVIWANEIFNHDRPDTFQAKRAESDPGLD